MKQLQKKIKKCKLQSATAVKSNLRFLHVSLHCSSRNDLKKQNKTKKPYEFGKNYMQLSYIRRWACS